MAGFSNISKKPSCHENGVCVVSYTYYLNTIHSLLNLMDITKTQICRVTALISQIFGARI